MELLGELVLSLVDEPLGDVELCAEVLPVLLVDWLLDPVLLCATTNAQVATNSAAIPSKRFITCSSL